MTMIRRMLIALVLSFTSAFTIGTITYAQAPQVALSAHTAVLVTRAPASWTARTCAAFTRWEHHQTRGNLEALVVDSFHVKPKYLGADIGQLYADVEGGGTKYVSDDAQYVYEDCHDGSGL